jgi:hypothetical protein
LTGVTEAVRGWADVPDVADATVFHPGIKKKAYFSTTHFRNPQIMKIVTVLNVYAYHLQHLKDGRPTTAEQAVGAGL